MFLYAYRCMSVFIGIFPLSLSLCVCVWVCVCMCVCLYGFVCMDLCMCVCIVVYVFDLVASLVLGLRPCHLYLNSLAFHRALIRSRGVA